MMVVGVLVALCAGFVPAHTQQQSTQSFVRWAADHAVPLRTVEAAGDSSDLLPLLSMVHGARVVAIGEPAHGAHEPLALRNRLFQFLVERAGVTAIAIESGFSESRRVQNFIHGAPDTDTVVVKKGLTWGFGGFPENLELVRWMREYNANPAHQRKLDFYGIDLSAGSNGGFGRARIAVDDVLAYLARGDAQAARRIRAELDPYLDRFSSAGYAGLTPDERRRISAGISGLAAVVKREHPVLLRATSADDDAWAARNALVASRLDTFFRVTPPPTADGSIPPGLYRGMNTRDAAMADNVLWVLKQEGPGSRVVVFAHNGHVANAGAAGPLWKALPHSTTSMGQHLRAALGDSLFIIGTSSAHNAAGLPGAALDPEGLDAALARVGRQRFLLDLRDARSHAVVYAWLRARHTLRLNFDTYQVLSPAIAFDAVAFVDTLTPGTP